MKKVIFAVVAVLALGLASCSKTCKCTETINGVSNTVPISEQTLQKQGKTCEQYNEVLELASRISQAAGANYSASCKY